MVKNTETSETTPGTSEANLFDRPGGGERAVIVHLDMGGLDVEESIEEFAALAESAGAEVVSVLTNRRGRPDPRFFIGTGKVDELAAVLRAEEADLVLVNHAISPAQERNLERALQCRVLDRTGLILDIFAQRARSHEGKLQVELAQLRHMASRLVRGWSHLERQKGGIGLRGPGETQLEMDRRMLGLRIKQLERRLVKVRRQRSQGRQARKKRELPAISLVGYTNAGKSTLFNHLTTAEVYAADQLFATLDTTLRRLELSTGQPVIIADTVGFVRDLPHQLVAAFRSTLEEVIEADLLLHVVDAADEDRANTVEQVKSVLADIGAGEVPVLYVYNKVDLLDREPGIDRDDQGRPLAVWLSAASGEGLELLRQALTERVGEQRFHGWVTLRPEQGRLRARLFQLGKVLQERTGEQGEAMLEVDLPRRDFERLRAGEGLRAESC
ncbi:ribosome rescue GTPase HflX [Alkalilimnicola sp. S0819]|uniref:ribosome rescue GTPase HflX n=1 Tax=Alkalilimnicola sp. S0819 TaxID=2613922 RepID=UPI0012624204|nr:ribosome rescue GTPase HflX [Alkalilimnicola sp. S0819]KAB7628354.1 GTPase HflX [Alkalilimnicola sp. S0819]MPQ15255.1 GTPase HflX [Alkalilimnicola sp. S0819]